MSIELNHAAVSHARSLIRAGKVGKSAEWSGPETHHETKKFEESPTEYSKWYLGRDTDHPADTKGGWKFPVSKNFETIDRAGCMAAYKRAAEFHYSAIEKAAKGLVDMIDKKESNAALPLEKEDFYGLNVKITN
jgi:hypothetical protein